MRLSHSSIFIVTCITCLGFDPSPAGANTHDQAPKILKIAQATTDTATQSILVPGTTGKQVQALQNQLKKLGYYNGEVDGDYGRSTRLAVSKFQQAKGLVADGVVGTTTRNSLLLAAKQNQQKQVSPFTSSTPKPSTNQQQEQGFIWWSLVGIGVLGVVGALLYLIKSSRRVVPRPETINITSKGGTNEVLPSQQLETKNYQQSNSTASPAKVMPLETTSRLAKIDIVDELIEDVRSPDPTKRRKAIWDLGQQGDSRAIQPLVELMIDADSQQRSLILAALAEIGTRTLKPMNRALAISLQDESPQVRQNAIRDLTRVYDFMTQISQMLSHAMQDPDAEVQATARYAMTQMNRIRALPSQEQEEDTEVEEEN